MSELHTMEQIVLKILEENPVSRENDYVLYAFVCAEKSGKTALVNGEYLTKPFLEVMMSHKAYKIPNWETVTRCRRKIQEKRPDLIAPTAARKRRNKEEKYKEYAHT